jgi:hypothetical protein
MQRAVELIPAAWQFPENACACIRLDGQEYQSKHFKTTSWHQNTPIKKAQGQVSTSHIASHRDFQL